ncbi:MAG: antibiotic biosynthesis monooxygenase [Candidatus Aminicenantales bacterium]
MFARSISMRLKPNSVTEFIQTLQNEIDPLLRKEQGFRGHIAFLVPDGSEAVAISFWDRKQGRISHSGRRCKVLVTLEKLVKGPPDARVCEIPNSTSDDGGLLRSFVHVEGVRHIEIYEVSRSIFRAIAAEGLASD